MYHVRLVREKAPRLQGRAGQPITAAADVAAIFKLVAEEEDREEFAVVLLDGKNRVRGVHVVSIGSLTAALVHPREVFRVAIVQGAAAVILVHNHPSGDPAPSAEDQALTKRLREVGELIGIRVLDHVVLGEGGAYVSLAETEGW